MYGNKKGKVLTLYKNEEKYNNIEELNEFQENINEEFQENTYEESGNVSPESSIEEIEEPEETEEDIDREAEEIEEELRRKKIIEVKENIEKKLRIKITREFYEERKNIENEREELREELRKELREKLREEFKYERENIEREKEKLKDELGKLEGKYANKFDSLDENVKESFYNMYVDLIKNNKDYLASMFVDSGKKNTKTYENQITDLKKEIFSLKQNTCRKNAALHIDEKETQIEPKNISQSSQSLLYETMKLLESNLINHMNKLIGGPKKKGIVGEDIFDKIISTYFPMCVYESVSSKYGPGDRFLTYKGYTICIEVKYWGQKSLGNINSNVDTFLSKTKQSIDLGNIHTAMLVVLGDVFIPRKGKFSMETEITDQGKKFPLIYMTNLCENPVALCLAIDNLVERVILYEKIDEKTIENNSERIKVFGETKESLKRRIRMTITTVDEINNDIENLKELGNSLSLHTDLKKLRITRIV